MPPTLFMSWKRLRQKLLWELRDEADTEDSFHYLTVPLPPRVDGFPGFSLNGFKGAVIGFVIQVSKSNFSVREWNIKLEHPMAKVSYALIRDHLGRVQAFSLTTFHPLQVIGGLSPAVFNMAGFPVDMGSPTTAESLVMGIPRFIPSHLPPYSQPLLRLGWRYNEDRSTTPPELIVPPGLTVMPGTWLSYKLPNLATRRDLAEARHESIEIDNLYRAAGSMTNTPEYGDPLIHRRLHQQYLERASRRNVSPDPYYYYDQLWWDPNTTNDTADETTVAEETGGDSGTPDQAEKVEEEEGEVLTVPHLGNIGTTPNESSWWEHLEDEERDMLLSDTISSNTLPPDNLNYRSGPEVQVGSKLDSLRPVRG